MEQEVKHAVGIGIQLILSASIIAIILSTLYIGKSLIAVRANERNSGELLAQQSLFSNYINNSGGVNGSDVVDIILTYSKIYNFAVVDKTSGKANVVMYRLTGDDIDKFRSEAIIGELKTLMLEDFGFQMILTSDGYAIQGLVFTHGGVCDQGELEQIKTNTFKLTSEFSYK